MGLWQPRPKYTDRVYYSSKCMPTKGETRLFHSMMRRTRRSVREVIALVAQAKESFLRSDKNMEEYIRVSDRSLELSKLYSRILQIQSPQG